MRRRLVRHARARRAQERSLGRAHPPTHQFQIQWRDGRRCAQRHSISAHPEWGPGRARRECRCPGMRRGVLWGAGRLATVADPRMHPARAPRAAPQAHAWHSSHIARVPRLHRCIPQSRPAAASRARRSERCPRAGTRGGGTPPRRTSALHPRPRPLNAMALAPAPRRPPPRPAGAASTPTDVDRASLPIRANVTNFSQPRVSSWGVCSSLRHQVAAAVN